MGWSMACACIFLLLMRYHTLAMSHRHAPPAPHKTTSHQQLAHSSLLPPKHLPTSIPLPSSHPNSLASPFSYHASHYYHPSYTIPPATPATIAPAILLPSSFCHPSSHPSYTILLPSLLLTSFLPSSNHPSHCYIPAPNPTSPCTCIPHICRPRAQPSLSLWRQL